MECECVECVECGVCGVMGVCGVWCGIVCGVCRWMCVECECEESGECVWNVMVCVKCVE